MFGVASSGRGKDLLTSEIFISILTFKRSYTFTMTRTRADKAADVLMVKGGSYRSFSKCLKF